MRRISILLAFILFVPAVCCGLVIDTLDSTATISTGGTGTMDVFKTTEPAHLSGVKGITFDYDLTIGTNVYIYSKSRATDLSGGDSILLYLKGEGNANNLEFSLYDTGDDRWVAKVKNITNTNNTWIPVVLPFSALNRFDELTGPLDYENISKIEIVISKSNGGTGSVLIDELQLYQNIKTNNILVDSCELGASYAIWNVFSNEVKPWVPDGFPDQISFDIEAISPSPAGGGYYKIDYNMISPNGNMVVENDLVVNGSSMSVVDMAYLAFYMKGKIGWERPEIEISCSKSNGALEIKSVNIFDYGDLTTEWQYYTIPITDFNLDNYSKLSKVKVSFKANDDVIGTGTVYIDDIRFTKTDNPDDVVGTVIASLDSMDNCIGALSSWKTNTDDDGVVSMSLSNAEGYTEVNSESALKIDYSFPWNADWLSLLSHTGYNFSLYKGVSLDYAGTGNENDIDFRITDSYGSTFYKRFYRMTDTKGKWKTLKIPLDEFTSYNTIVSTININNIQLWTIEISKNKGGTGTVAFDNLQLVETFDYTYGTAGFAVINTFKIDNNPISPNGDGAEDTAKFTYMLNDWAEVKLEVFSLRGKLVFSTEVEDKAGDKEFIIEWGGTDKGGKRVPNGLYFYKFTAKGDDGTRDVIKHIIGVIR